MNLSIKIFGHHLVRFNHLKKILLSFLPLKLSQQKVSFNIIFINRKTIHELNRKYLDEDRSTDVLTFPLNQNFQIDNQNQDQIELGDIYICPKVAFVNHQQVDNLIVHGFLHLIGLDHQTLQQSVKWNKIEKVVLEKIYNYEKIFQ